MMFCGVSDNHFLIFVFSWDDDLMLVRSDKWLEATTAEEKKSCLP